MDPSVFLGRWIAGVSIGPTALVYVAAATTGATADAFEVAAFRRIVAERTRLGSPTGNNSPTDMAAPHVPLRTARSRSDAPSRSRRHLRLKLYPPVRR